MITSSIVLGDCLEEMAKLPDGIIDLVLVDPPYGISKEMKISRSSQGKFKGNALTNDYGKWDEFDSTTEHFEFTKKWCSECDRLLRPGGTFISFFDKVKLEWFSNILPEYKIRDTILWIKNNPVPQLRKVKFAQATEMGIVMVKPGGKTTFMYQNGYHPNYIRLPIVGGHQRLKDSDGNTLHPTQKPEMLMRWLVDYWSAPDDLVLDPFAGTGTTAVACIKSRRRFICIEQLEKYYIAMAERLAGTQMQFVPIDYKSKEYKERYR